MPEEVKNNAAEQAAQAQKQPVPMPTTYEALRQQGFPGLLGTGSMAE